MLLLFQPRTTLICAWLIISDAGYFVTNKEGPNHLLKVSADFCFRTLLLVLHGNTIIDVYLDSIGISYWKSGKSQSGHGAMPDVGKIQLSKSAVNYNNKVYYVDVVY